jgi:hypothetical protein
MRKFCGLVVTIAAALALGVPAAQSAVVVNDSIPFSLIAFVPCANGGAGEAVLVEGNLHVLITETVNDNNASFKVHFQPQGAEGIGLTTGDTYRATGETQEHVSLGPSLADTFVNNFKIIGQGPDNNLLVHQTIHLTINANGELTAEVLNESIECR